MGGLGGIKKRRAEYASLEHDFETSLSSINSRDRDRDSERERDFDNSPSPAPESPTRLEAEHFRQSREEDGDRDEGDDDKVRLLVNTAGQCRTSSAFFSHSAI